MENKFKYVKLIESGNSLEVMRMERMNNENFIRIIDKYNYIDLRQPLQANGDGTAIDIYSGQFFSGDEIFKYKNKVFALKKITNSEKRVEGLDRLRATMRRLRNIVNANTAEPDKCKWLTLTYAENMRDTDKLYSDMHLFMKKMRYALEHFEYISVIEPQARGAWHAHIILIFNDKAPFIPAKWIEFAWGHGYIDIQNVDDNDGIGNYLTVYLTDVKLSDEGLTVSPGDEIIERQVNGESKKFVKGARLYLYPANMQIYRHSRGIKKPTEKIITEDEAKALDENYALQYSKMFELDVEKNGYFNTIKYDCYNKKRPKQKEDDAL